MTLKVHLILVHHHRSG